MTTLEMKDKLLSAIALADQVVDEIAGDEIYEDTTARLKRISSELFEIGYDI